MVDNTGSSKTQMEGGLGGGYPQSGPAGFKLEAMMEQLQRQQQARLDMERKEQMLHEAHIMYAQQVAAQQAILAAARASGAGFMGKGLGTGTAGPPGVEQLSRVSNQYSVDSEREDEEERGRDSGEEDDDDEMMEGDEGSEEYDRAASGLEFLRKQTLALQQGATRIPTRPFGNFGDSPAPAGAQRAPSPPLRVKQEPDDDLSPAERPSASSPNGQADWSFDEHFKQNGSVSWPEDVDNARRRGEASREFTKLYELDNDPNRKEFLDDLFTFMQKRGTPVNRIPIMAKKVLDLYMLYKLVTEKGGLVEVINKKIWREITKGLHLPTSITSAAFTLRTQYMKYLYPYECERKALSSPSELQAAIDGNRREGRRPSYSNSLFHFSPSPSSAPHILSPPKMHLSALGPGAVGVLNGLQASPRPSLKKGLEDAVPSLLSGRSPVMALALGQHQVAGLARAATLEQLREKLETEAPERKIARLAEEQQKLMQQAFQHNLLTMTSHIPMNLRLAAPPRDEKHDLSMSISSTGVASISVSVEVNGIIYSGTLFAQKSAAAGVNVSAATTASSAGPSGVFTFPGSAPSQSPSSSSSSKGPSSAEPSTSGSP
ncbi:AT-rich interactive domain-containing protein 3B-like [Myxocyprinus asiaticus]|uniref:AT-rich interactive domain-containing protein 3B-like n=1 Tax=Myxocyprinus asiaticus TaxID=70543 RepID=UPI0022226E92|nr:AT-rich interactive domain-containing protein 3B-like [Myxocyprinus asiaticus]